MSRTLTPDSSLETLKKEAKRWLKALRAGDAEARRRLVTIDRRGHVLGERLVLVNVASSRSRPPHRPVRACATCNWRSRANMVCPDGPR